MTSYHEPKLPMPVEVKGFQFLSSPAAPNYSVLEFQTPENPVRVFLTRAQMLELAAKAKAAATKIQD